jgi:NAD(P)-dependent dehydrogenase (short-subunit alcohol dehydrogenase family)
MFDAMVAGGNALIQGARRGIGLEFARQCLAEPRIGHVVTTCRSPQDATGLADLADVNPESLARAFAVNAIGPLLVARHFASLLAHPGTTDTDLSRPFQANVPAGKLFGVDYAVSQMLGVIDRLQPADSGQFFAWDGERIPW